VPRRPGRLRLIALGAALAYFFDPANGRERRKGVVKRLAGLSSRLRPETGDDATLARRVETEIRGSGVPEGKVDVNAENGKIVLRGEVASPQLIDDLVAKARSVQGVQEVESLLQATSG
jgi:osmotically-inducible protein OsmY